LRNFPFKILVVALLLSTCQTIPVKVPIVKTKEPVEIKNSASLATIKFDRIGFKIKRGTAIESYEPDLLGLSCVLVDGNIFWNQGRVLARNIEFEDIFFDEMKVANFNVIGDPDKMFANASDKKKKSNFLIGGKIDEIKLEVCEQINWWTGFPRGTKKGKGAIKVRWQVFSVLNIKVVFETTTQGAAKLEMGVGGGEMVLIHNAFGNGVVNLTPSKKFVDLLTAPNQTIVDIKNVENTELAIDRYPPRQQKTTNTIDQTRLSVVSIDAEYSHGSGFFIAPDLIMTNFHVVGNGQFIRLTLLTGRKI